MGDIVITNDIHSNNINVINNKKCDVQQGAVYKILFSRLMYFSFPSLKSEIKKLERSKQAYLIDPTPIARFGKNGRENCEYSISSLIRHVDSGSTSRALLSRHSAKLLEG